MPDPTGDITKLGYVVGGAIDEISKKLDTLKKNYADTFSGSSTTGPAASMAKYNTIATAATETTKKMTAQASAMVGVFKGMSEVLSGPVGVASSIYAVSKALGSFAESRVQLQNMSTDLGFTIKQIDVMGHAMRRMGMSPEESKQIISNIGQMTKEMFAHREGSQLYGIWRDSGEAKFGQELLKYAGDSDKVFKMMMEHLEQGGARYRAHMAPLLGITEAMIENYSRLAATIGQVWEASYEHSEKYLISMDRMETKISNIIGKTAEGLFPKMESELHTIDVLLGKIEEVDHWLDKYLPGKEGGDFLGRASAALGATKLYEQYTLSRDYEPSAAGPEAMWPGAARLLTPKEQAARPAITARSLGMPGGFRYGDFPGGPDYGPGGTSGVNIPEVTKSSNEYLKSIRDSIAHIEQRFGFGGEEAGGPGGGGGGTPGRAGPGGGAGPHSFRRGIGPGRTADVGSAGVGYSDDLSKAAYDKMFKNTPLEGQYDKVVEVAKKNNVPPSLMAGIMAHETAAGHSKMLAEKMNPAGLMDPATGHATALRFPDVGAGIEKAGEVISRIYKSGGGTIEGMGKIYAPVGAANDPGGLNAGWAAGVALYRSRLSTGVPGGSPGGVGGITLPAGSALGSVGLANVTTHDGKKYLVDARFAPNFQGFINDYEKAGGELGPNVNTLTYRGGNPSGHPAGAAIDVNQIARNIRAGGKTLPLDVENRLAAKWGLVPGSTWRSPDAGHFSIRSVEAARKAVENIKPAERPELNEFDQMQPPYRSYGRQPEMDDHGRKHQEPWPNLDDARRRLDKTQSHGGEARAVKHDLDVDIDFKNVPSWVKTSIAGGKFSRLKVTRSTAGGSRSEEPVGSTDSNRWSY